MIQDDGGTDQLSYQDRPASDISTTKDRSTTPEYQDSPTTHQDSPTRYQDSPTRYQDTTDHDSDPPVPQVLSRKKWTRRKVDQGSNYSNQKWTAQSTCGCHNWPPGPVFVAKSGPPSEKWPGRSFRSLARLWGIKNITNDTIISVLCHDREFRLFCDSYHQQDSWPCFRY